MEEIWGVFKDIIYEALQKFVPCKILKKSGFRILQSKN